MLYAGRNSVEEGEGESCWRNWLEPGVGQFIPWNRWRVE